MSETNISQDTSPNTSPNETGNEEENKPKKDVKREVISWIITIAAAVAVALLIRTLLFEPIRVDGESMTNTLQDNQIVIATKPEYLMGNYHRGDIVICQYPGRGSTLFVKRLIALPGDTLEIVHGTVFINGLEVDESNIDINIPWPYDYPRVTMQEDQYFVMGDNRGNSNDSRRVGPISSKMIKGHVTFSIWPFSTFGSVK